MNHARRLKPSTGFTFIEVMIVVAIIAILTAVALPSYQEYLRRGNRAEARAGLLQAAQWLERVATASGVYLTNQSTFPTALQIVPSRTYVISIEVPSDGSGSGYTLTATPQGSQVGDQCGAYTLDHAGTQGLASDSPSDSLIATCWNR
jgi:type IV pilus assembly protein PilE